MAQYNPFRSSFDQAKNFQKYSNLALWISAIILSVTFMIDTLSDELSHISEFLNAVNCFFILSFAVLSFISSNISFNASSTRRVDFIDNSFDSSYSENSSIEYYTNEDVISGIYKMAVNSFENSFFTLHIAEKMTKAMWLKNLIFALLILGFAIFGFNNAFILLIQLTLPILLIQEALNHTLFVYRINRVCENFRRLFNDLKDESNPEKKKPEIILNVLEYETTIASGSILLDSKIYEEYNDELSKKWAELKSEYNIGNIPA